MTNSERAEKILEITDRWDMKPVDMLAFITAQLDEAVQEATELDFSKWPDLETRLEGIAESANRGQSKRAVKVVLRTLVDQAVRERDLYWSDVAKQSWNACREKAAGIAEELEWKDWGHDRCLDIAERIRGMSHD